MILNFLNETIEIPSIAKDYTRNYSDIPEEDFMTMVKMDPSSYPKSGNEFDINQEPIKVGGLASGGGGGLLSRCYRKGEKDFLNNFKRVQDACAKFLKNRSSYSIKNAGAFESVKDFLTYVESDGTAEIGVNSQATPQKKKQTSEDKLEILRQKQFPKISTLAELIAIADLDEESDTEHGQIGNIARNLLLPHYAAGERDFLNKRVSLKKAIAKYYNLDPQSVKEKPLNKYDSIKDFIIDVAGVDIINNNLMSLLNNFADNGEDYTIVCRSKNYDVIRYSSQKVGYIIDLCDYPIEQVIAKYANKSTGVVDLSAWAEDNDPNLTNSSMITNTWCTGWYDRSYWKSYSEKGGNSILIAFIKRDRIPFRKQAHLNWQMSLYHADKVPDDDYDRRATGVNSVSNIHDVEDGNNNHEAITTNLPGFISMLRTNPDIIPYLLSIQECRECAAITSLAKELNISITDYKNYSGIVDASVWDDEVVEVEPEPFKYEGPQSLIDYKEQHSMDPTCSLIESIVIADGVTEIPNFEFHNFRHLTKVKFPESLKVIGHKAFSGCNALPRISLPPNLEKIGMGAFESCTVLRGSIRLPLSLKYIGKNAFTNYVIGDFKSAISRKIKFTLSPKRLNEAEYPEPLLVPEDEAEDYVNKISLSDN